MFSMVIFLISFFSTFLFILAIIRFNYMHIHITGDNDLNGPQKFHFYTTPRIGGLGIYLGLWAGGLATFFKDANSAKLIFLLLTCALSVFIAGFVEDITKKVSLKTRFFAGLASGALLVFIFNINSIRLDIWGLDDIVAIPLITFLFLSFACCGLSNAYNIIDGFNGLSSMVGIISTTAIAYVAFKVSDIFLLNFSLILIGSTLGFFIWNYPKGHIFLGDCGAYLIGFINAALCILLIYRNQAVSPWFAILVNAYPIFETLFTIWRRTVHQGKNPALPDGAHFHTLIYRRIMRWINSNSIKQDNSYIGNAKTSPFLWLISSLGVIPSVIFWNNTLLLVLSTIFFVTGYIQIYRKIVRFNTPYWLKFKRENKLK